MDEKLHRSARAVLIEISVLLTLWLQTLMWRVPLLGVSLDSDTDFFAYFSRQILAGKVPYRDVIDNKPPFHYYSGAFFSWISGDMLSGYWIQEFCYVGLTVTLLFLMMRTILPVLHRVVLCSLFLLLINCSFFYYFRIGYMENTLNFWTVLAYAIVFRGKDNWRTAVLTAVAVSCAVLTKQIGLFTAIPIWISFCACRQWRMLLIHGLTLLALAGIFVAYFVYLGALDDLWYWVVVRTKLMSYMKHDLTFANAVETNRFPSIVYILGLLPVFLYLSYFGLRRIGLRYVILLLWLLGAGTSVALAGWSLYAHYFVVLAPPLTMCLAYGWHARSKTPLSWNWSILSGVSIALFSVLIFPQLQKFNERASKVEKLRVNDRAYAFLSRRSDVVSHLRKIEPQDGPPSFYIWTPGYHVCALALEVNAWIPGNITASVLIDPRYPHPRREEAANRWMEDFKAVQTKYLMLPKGQSLEKALPKELHGWAQSHYTLRKEFVFYSLWTFKDGASGGTRPRPEF